MNGFGLRNSRVVHEREPDPEGIFRQLLSRALALLATSPHYILQQLAKITFGSGRTNISHRLKIFYTPLFRFNLQT
jgi:hypothetical protein